MSGDFATVRYERDGAIVTLTLNEPERRNPLGDVSIGEIVAALERYHADDEAKVLIVTGAGSAFSAGGDFEMMRQWRHLDEKGNPTQPFDPIDQRELYRRGIQRIPRTFEMIDKPVLAAINGAAVGAGCDLSLMTDIRIASDRATFGEVFRHVGLTSGDGGAWHLTRLVGVEKALELLYTGDIIDAAEAHRIGMISRVVPHEKLMDETRALADRIARGPLRALRMAKFAVRRAMNQSLDESLETMALMQSMLHGTEDHLEGLRAFADKRRPEFKGR